MVMNLKFYVFIVLCFVIFVIVKYMNYIIIYIVRCCIMNTVMLKVN